MHIVKIEIYPAAQTGVLFLDYVISPDVAVLLAAFVNKSYCLYQINEFNQHRAEMAVEIVVMVFTKFQHMVSQSFAFNKVYYPDYVSGGVSHRKTLHEIWMPFDHIENDCLFSRTSDTIECYIADLCLELLVKDHLDNLYTTVSQIDCSSDPELGLIINTETTLVFIIPHQIRQPIKNHDIVIVYLEEIRYISDDPRR